MGRGNYDARDRGNTFSNRQGKIIVSGLGTERALRVISLPIGSRCCTFTDVIESVEQQVALATTVPILLQFLIGAGALVYGLGSKRIHRPKGKRLAFVVTALGSIFIVGLGFLIQPIVDQLIGAADGTFGHVYAIEFAQSAYLTNSLFKWLGGGFMPGLLLTVILFLPKHEPSRRLAAIAGAGVLVFSDALNHVLVRLLLETHLANLWTPLAFSLLCDVVGGPLAGLVCRWFALATIDHLTASRPLRNLGPAALRVAELIGALIVVVAVGYLLFVRPTPTTTVLRADAVTKLFLRYDRTDVPQVRGSAGSLTERLRNTQSWEFGPNEVSTTGLGVGTLKIRLQAFSEGGPITVRILPLHNCATAEEASIFAKATSSGGRVLSLDQASLRVLGSYQGISDIRLSDPESKLRLIVPDGQSLLISTEGKGRQLNFFGRASLDIPVAKGSTLVLSTMQEWLNRTTLMHLLPEKVSDVGNPAIVVSNKSQPEVQLRLPARVVHGETCSVADFIDDKKLSEDSNAGVTLDLSYFVVEVLDAPQDARLTLDLSKFAVFVPREAITIESDRVTDPIDYVGVVPGGGMLSLGAQRFELQPEDRVDLAGDRFEVTENAEGKLDVAGTSRYALLNGERIIPSWWATQTGYVQTAVGTLFALGFGWLWREQLGRFVRRAIDR